MGTIALTTMYQNLLFIQKHDYEKGKFTLNPGRNNNQQDLPDQGSKSND